MTAHKNCQGVLTDTLTLGAITQWHAEISLSEALRYKPGNVKIGEVINSELLALLKTMNSMSLISP